MQKFIDCGIEIVEKLKINLYFTQRKNNSPCSFLVAFQPNKEFIFNIFYDKYRKQYFKAIKCV